MANSLRAVLCCLMACLALTLSAQNNFFRKNIKQGYWQNPDIWQGGQVPGPGDKVLLNAPVTIGADVSCQMLITNGFAVHVTNGAKLNILGESVGMPNDSLAVLNLLTPNGGDTLQMRYRTNEIEFFVYGTKPGETEEVVITRTDYRDPNDTAAVVHMYLDPLGRGSLMFQSENGQMDSICYKFTYFDSLVSVSAFLVNWNSGELSLKTIQVLKATETTAVPVSGSTSPALNTLDFNIDVGMTACWSVLKPALFLAGGAALGYFAAPVLGAAALKGALFGGLTGLAASLRSANAAEPDPMVRRPLPVTPKTTNVITQNPSLLSPTNYGTTVPLVLTEAVKMDAIDKVMVEARTLAEGGSTITSRGICWNSDPQNPPTINSNKVLVTPAVSPFAVQFVDLQPEVTYYYRSFATNSNGTSYGATLPYKRPETIDTIALLVNHGIWDAFFWGASASGDNKLGMMEFFRQSPECPDLITSFTRIDKIHLRFAGDYTGGYGELTDDNYFSAWQFSDCTASGLVHTYEWFGEGYTWQYNPATRMLTAQSLPEEGNPPQYLFQFQIEKITETELAGTYYGVDDKDDFVYGGYLRLR